jgi:LCP family protein required for cell wall assembly
MNEFFKRISIKQIIVVVAAIALGVAAFAGVRFFIRTLPLTIEGTNPVFTDNGNPQLTPGAPETTPTVAAPINVDYPDWDGTSRVTVLIMGLDYADWSPDREGPPRSDTMILLTIDPLSKTAGMLSVPRDLWVNIPGFGYYKINQAYYFGEGAKLPGGGPELARKTVEQAIGVPIDYYAQVDFAVFVRLVDEIGGVKITVDQEIKIDPIGPGNTVTLTPGRYTLDGELALAYARQRYTENGDVDRSNRQMQVIMAVRDRLLDPSYAPELFAKAPLLYQELGSGVRTNMSFNDAIALARLAIQVKEEDLLRRVMDFSMMEPARNSREEYILLPIPDKVREMRDEVFTTGGPLSPLAQGEDPLALAKAEGARISVLNGAGVDGLAGRTGEYFTSLGLTVAELGNGTPSTVTIVYDYTGNPYTLKYLQTLFNLSSPAQVVSKYDPNATVDVVVNIGGDWATNNPMP